MPIPWITGKQIKPQPITADQEAKLKAACSKHGVSEKLMTGLLMAESQNNKYAKSPTGCSGYFQFTQKTFQSMTKGASTKVAPPLTESDLDFGVQAEAAAKLMSQNLTAYKGHSMQQELALLAYNAGPGVANVAKDAMKGGDDWVTAVKKGIDKHSNEYKTPEIRETKLKEAANYPNKVLGKAGVYSAAREKASMNEFVISEDMAQIYQAIHDSSIVDLSRSTQDLVIREGLDEVPWYKDPTAVVGNPKLKAIQPIWFKVLLSPTNYLADKNGKPVELRLNCSLKEMDLSMKHKYNKTQTRTGVHLTLWGMEADVITGSGSTGAWMNQYGLTTFMSSERANPEMAEWISSQKLPGAYGKYEFFKQFAKDYKAAPSSAASNLKVAAQDAFVELLALFKYNAVTRFKNDGYTGFMAGRDQYGGNLWSGEDMASLDQNGAPLFPDRDQLGGNLWSEQYGTSSAVAGARNNDVMYRGQVVMGTKDDIYTGYFKSLSFREDSEKPYRWDFNFTFQVQSKTKFTGMPQQ